MTMMALIFMAGVEAGVIGMALLGIAMIRNGRR